MAAHWNDRSPDVLGKIGPRSAGLERDAEEDQTAPLGAFSNSDRSMVIDGPRQNRKAVEEDQERWDGLA